MNKEGTIIVSQKFDCSRDFLWEALTSHKLIVQWFFPNIPEFRPEVGFKTRFSVESGSRVFIHKWEILEVLASQHIIIDWRYENFPGKAKVIFKVSEMNEACELEVISLGMNSFPQEIDEFKRESCEGGWRFFINDSLHNFIKCRKNV